MRTSGGLRAVWAAISRTQDPEAESHRNLRATAIMGIGWTGLAQASKQALRFAVSIMLARVLLPEDFGLVGMVSIFTGFAAWLTELGFGAALIQKQDVDYRHYSSVFWLTCGVGLTFTALIMASAPFLALFYDEPRLSALTRVAAVQILVNSSYVVPYALLNRQMRFQTLAAIEITAVTVGGLVAALVAVLGGGAWSLVLQMLAMAIVASIGTWVLSAWRPHFLFSRSSIGELLGYSLNLLGYNIIGYWIRNSDNFLVGKFIGSFGLGLYSRAYNTMLLPTAQITAVLTRVVFPALSSIQDDRAKVRGVYLRLLSVAAFVSFPIMIGLAIVARDFVLVLFGPKWVEMTRVTQILCLVGFLQSITSTTSWIYQSQGQTSVQFRWGLVSWLFTIAGFLVGIQAGRIEAVAGAYLVVNILLFYWLLAVPGRLIEATFADILRALVGGISCVSVMSAGLVIAKYLLPMSWSSQLRLLGQLLLGVLLYLVAAHLLNVPPYRELRVALGEFLKKRA